MHHIVHAMRVDLVTEHLHPACGHESPPLGLNLHNDQDTFGRVVAAIQRLAQGVQ